MRAFTCPDCSGLAFDLLSSAQENVTIGHASGVVTIDLTEGDDGYREQLRIRLAEPYRTMLGHLRHETGHWYWEVLVDRPGNRRPPKRRWRRCPASGLRPSTRSSRPGCR